jgi:hypothetical protein
MFSKLLQAEIKDVAISRRSNQGETKCRVARRTTPNRGIVLAEALAPDCDQSGASISRNSFAQRLT